MTERMQSYRKRMEGNGFVQVRIRVEKQDEKFIKFVAKFCRDRKKQLKEKKRFGRRASDSQIMFAKEIAKANEIPEPEHLYDYHISLSAWTWRYKNTSKDC